MSVARYLCLFSHWLRGLLDSVFQAMNVVNHTAFQTLLVMMGRFKSTGFQILTCLHLRVIEFANNLFSVFLALDLLRS